MSEFRREGPLAKILPEWWYGEVGTGQVGEMAWAWYDAHRDDSVLVVRVLFVKKTLRVRDLHLLFLQLFGSHP